jgi:hypothetical protein
VKHWIDSAVRKVWPQEPEGTEQTETDDHSIWRGVATITEAFVLLMKHYPPGGYVISDDSKLPVSKSNIRMALILRMQNVDNQQQRSYWEELLFRSTYFQPKVGKDDLFKDGVNWNLLHSVVTSNINDQIGSDEADSAKQPDVQELYESLVSEADPVSARRFHDRLFDVQREQREMFENLRKLNLVR